MSDRHDLPRTVLPIPDRPRTGLITYDANDPDTKFPPIEQLRPPKGAPNVLVILLDDAGYGSSSAFGGPCQTPVAEKLAADGLKYLRFHTTALCSPTRPALLTGRNHHTVGMATRCAWSSPTRVAAWGKAGRRRSISTERQSGQRRSGPQPRWCFLPTTAAMSRPTADRPSLRTTARAATSSRGA
jgi:hypothetical protein